ncbi:unnamed protein product [Lupinus luteus]|uniref:Organ-specific protein P4 n=1 Tax=Lupinus luteus TaxID=3873 RepID=A0AAV1XZ14_LUPLU
MRLALLPLLFLYLFVDNVESRKDPGEDWRLVMKDIEKKLVVDDFEPRPNLSTYGENNIDVKKKETAKNLESIFKISAYGDDIEAKEKNVMKFFEPRPDLFIHGGDVDAKEKNVVKDFEPRPNLSAYGKEDVDIVKNEVMKI